MLLTRVRDSPASTYAAGGHVVMVAIGTVIATGLMRRRRTRQRARAVASHQQHDALALVAHDLKTPLTILKGNAQLLQRHLGAGDGVERDRLQATLVLFEVTATAAAARLDEITAEIRQQQRPAGTGTTARMRRVVGRRRRP